MDGHSYAKSITGGFRVVAVLGLVAGATLVLIVMGVWKLILHIAH